MTNSFDKSQTIISILTQEKKNGCNNSVVIGGIDEFINEHIEFIPAKFHLKTPYRSLNVQQRLKWASGLISFFDTPKIKKTRTKINNPREKSQVFLEDSIHKLGPPVSQRNAKILLEKFSIQSVQDLLMHFPDRHDDFSDVVMVNNLIVGKSQSVLLTVSDARLVKSRRGRSDVFVRGSDSTGSILVTFYNQQWILKDLKKGSQIMMSGKVVSLNGKISLQNPSFEPIDKKSPHLHTGRLVPVYPLSLGLRQKTIRTMIFRALMIASDQINDFLPDNFLSRLGLMDLKTSIRKFHYPDSVRSFNNARRRLVFNELFFLQLSVQKRKIEWLKSVKSYLISPDTHLPKMFLQLLEFTPTTDQINSMKDITRDMASGQPMRRLLQGDVGSGKTLVAIHSILSVIDQGLQGALMAPTEVLAEQHFISIKKMFGGAEEIYRENCISVFKIDQHNKSISVALITGSMKDSEKQRIRAMLKNLEIDLIVGTHTLIQDTIVIPNLAIVVIDEQHRFGLEQREVLNRVNPRPHLLAMSATPIPRSLFLAMNGDFDLSIIKQLPSGRKPIETSKETSRERVYRFIYDQVLKGRQAFIVCPLVDESEVLQSRSAVEEHIRLSKEVFPQFNIGLLHGKMKVFEKDKVMESFRNGDINILVCTSVIEVGVDIPNASVMFIDGADRFGLSQLHQFRGRVGRGPHQSYCILLADKPSDDAKTRIELLRRIPDGFVLSEEDLKLRGFGEYIGTKQSGQPLFKIASIVDDQDILSVAVNEARQILDLDPELNLKEHQQIKSYFNVLIKEFLVS